MSGSVVSVNVGQPHTVQWHGRTITAGIFKSPVAGSIRIDRGHLPRNAQADRVNHGGAVRAVCVYAV
jgi:MOSC domain-containing protein YiiM